MIAVITGDIVNSRALPALWIETLKQALSSLPEKEAKWEIFRGDSFQVELSADVALLASIYIKASIKTIKSADVRLSIGLGTKAKTVASKVTEANGEAYINSGEAFDTLKSDKVNLAVKSPSLVFDEDMNLYFKLALIAMDNWSPIAADNQSLLDYPNPLAGVKATLNMGQTVNVLGNFEEFQLVKTMDGEVGWLAL